MSFLTRSMLPAFALAAMMSVAQAQTTGQDHQGHHPEGAAPTQAQSQAAPAPSPSMPMMGGMMGNMGHMGGMMPMMRPMMGQQGAMGMPFEHVEGRIAFLKAELKVTEAQTPQWNAFADALRANAKAHQSMHEQMGKGGMPSSWPERLAARQKMMSMHLDGLKNLEAAAKPLFAALTEEQKALADRLLSGPMGMM